MNGDSVPSAKSLQKLAEGAGASRERLAIALQTNLLRLLEFTAGATDEDMKQERSSLEVAVKDTVYS